MRVEVCSSSATIYVTVTPDMAASLDGHRIHPLYSTFWLAYHAEVAARKAIEPYFEEGENAIGTGLSLEHLAMCPIGARVQITATVIEYDGKCVICAVEARTDTTLIARGTQTQLVLPDAIIRQKILETYARYKLGLPKKT